MPAAAATTPAITEITIPIIHNTIYEIIRFFLFLFVFELQSQTIHIMILRIGIAEMMKNPIYSPTDITFEVLSTAGG